MYFTDAERGVIGPLSTLVENNLDKKFRIILQDDVELIATFYTDAEDDNGLELDDERYEEFHSYTFRVEEIIHKGKMIENYNYEGYKNDGYYLVECGTKDWPVKKGSLIDIIYHNFPKKIEVID